MATLPTLRPGAVDTTGLSGLISAPGGATALSDNADATSDATTVGTTGLAHHGRTLAALPGDFGSMDSLTVRLRFRRTTSQNLSTWNSIRARIVRADGTTLLAGHGANSWWAVASNISNVTASEATASFGFVDGTASPEDWAGAILQLQWDITRNKGGDSGDALVMEAWVNGTYTEGAPPVEQKSGPFATSNGHTVEVTGSKTSEQLEASGTFDLEIPHSVQVEGGKTGVGAFAVEQGIELELAGNKTGAIGSWALSQGHELEVAGSKMAVDDFAISHGHSVSIQGDVEVIQISGTFELEQGVEVDLVGAKTALGAFALHEEASVAFEGSKTGAGTFETEIGLSVSLVGSGAKSGVFALSHGHAVSIAGGAEPPEVASGTFSTEVGVEVAFEGEGMRVGAWELEQGHTLSVDGTGSRAGDFEIEHGHSISVLGDGPAPIEQRSGSFQLEQGLTVDGFLGRKTAAGIWSVQTGHQLAFSGFGTAGPGQGGPPALPRQYRGPISKGRSALRATAGHPPPYARPRSVPKER